MHSHLAQSQLRSGWTHCAATHLASHAPILLQQALHDLVQHAPLIGLMI